MNKINTEITANIVQGKFYIYFSINIAEVSDSYKHACFMHSVLDEITINTDIEDCYIIGLFGDNDIANKTHFGVFSSILIQSNLSFKERGKTIDYIWARLNAFWNEYNEDIEHNCDAYVIKCVPLIKNNGNYVLKKGVKINEGALNIREIPHAEFIIPHKFISWFLAVVLSLLIGFIIGKCL